MDNNDVKILVESFKGYRDLLSPIQANLNDFVETYDSMQRDIEKLNTAFGGDVKANLEKIYRNLSSQAEKATDLSSRIDQFIKLTNKYTSEVSQLMTVFGKVEERISAVNAIEDRATEQIAKLDAILEEKKKSYNIKELQRTLDSYNGNVQKVGEFINKDIVESLSQNRDTLETIKGGMENVVKRRDEDSATMKKLLESYESVNALLLRVTEQHDVDAEYLYDLLDGWAESRKIKRKKQ